jgi:hypothetical protein
MFRQSRQRMKIDDLFQSFDRLRRAWLQTKRGQGGLIALAGFEFQLSAGLFEMVKAGPQGRVFSEALSDIVQLEGGVLVTQVKRTLTSSAMTSALDELWDIECLARTNEPDLADKLRYRVLSSRRNLQNWEGTRQQWSRSGADAQALELFKQRVQAEVLPSPRLETARLLTGSFHDPDPMTRIDRWIGRLMVAASNGELDRAGEEITAELGALAQSHRDDAHLWGLWGTGDRAPDNVVFEPNERKAVRIGERLSVADLREGRLAHRILYLRLHDDVESWLVESDPGIARFPMFWVEGRSGAGKSAALLHLLAKMHGEDPDRVILWLGSRPERIRDALAWARPLLREGRQVVVALDDPCTAERQHLFAAALEEALADWEGLLVTTTPSSLIMPILVCCGPTEQRAVAEDLAASTARITPFALPRESEEDLEELATWYRLRTGRPAPDLHGEVLLVQRFFEWTKGRVREFALRFRERLHDLYPGPEPALFEMVARILALGRLYVDYPLDQLEGERNADPHLAAAMIRLVDAEAHFSLGADDRGGVRFTHPHLADAIYREWFGRPSDQPFRQRHLADGLAGIARADDRPPAQRLAPLWAIARMAQVKHVPNGTDLAARLELIRPELGSVLSGLFRELSPSPEPLADLPVWVLLDSLLVLGLIPPPREQLIAAIQGAGEPSRGLRLSCHILLAASDGDDRERAEAVVTDLLERASSWRVDGSPWFEWPRLAIDLLLRAGPGSIINPIERLATDAPSWPQLGLIMPELAAFAHDQRVSPLVISWLKNQQMGAPGWTAAMNRLYQVAGPSESLNEIALAFLRARPEAISWGHIFANLSEDGIVDRGELLRLGLRWLGFPPPVSREHDASPAFDRVLRQMVAFFEDDEDAVTTLLMRGWDWLECVDDNGGWSYVWRLLWDRYRNDSIAREQIGQIGVRWLRRIHAGHRGWSFVWHPLVRSGEGGAREDLLALALEWLQTADFRHRGWTFVLETFVELADTSLLDLAWPMIEQSVWAPPAINASSWPSIWKSAADLNVRLCHRHDDAIAAVALHWLRANPSANGWEVIFVRAQRLGLYSEELINLALSRSTRSDQPLRGRMRALAAAMRDARRVGNTNIAAKAIEILKVELDSSAWPTLWVAVVAATPRDQRGDVVALAKTWLNQVRDARSWEFVWSHLYRIDRSALTDPDVQAGSVVWLETGGADPALWVRVWFNHDRRAELLSRPEIMTKALDTVEATVGHFLWPFLWLTLFDAREEQRDKLCAIAKQWLESAKVKTTTYYAVWHRVFKGTAPTPLNVPDDPVGWLLDPQNGDNADWNRVLKTFKGQAAPLPDAVFEIGAARLRRDMDEAEWPAEWRTQFALASDNCRSALVALGFDWLRRPLRPPTAWASIWHRLMKVTEPGSSELEALREMTKPWLASLDREAKDDVHAAGWVLSEMRKGMRKKND